MSKVRVYGGLVHIKGKQLRAIVATTSKSKVANLIKEKVHYVSDFWAETFNSLEIKIALNKPNTLFVHCGHGDYVEKIFDEGEHNGQRKLEGDQQRRVA